MAKRVLSSLARSLVCFFDPVAIPGRIISDSIENYSRSHRCQEVDSQTQRFHRLATVATVVCINLDVCLVAHTQLIRFLWNRTTCLTKLFWELGRLIRKPSFEFRRFEVERWGPEKKSYRAVLRNERGEKHEPPLQLFPFSDRWKEVL